MKLKFILCVSLIAINYSAFSQSAYHPALQQGSVLASGSVGFSVGSINSESSSFFGTSKSEASYVSVSLTPKAAFFVTDGLAVGLNTDITLTSYKNKDSEATYSNTQYLIGPVIRYYFPIGIFLHGDLGFGKEIDKGKYGGQTDKDETKIISFQFGAGYAIFLNLCPQLIKY